MGEVGIGKAVGESGGVEFVEAREEKDFACQHHRRRERRTVRVSADERAERRAGRRGKEGRR